MSGRPHQDKLAIPQLAMNILADDGRGNDVLAALKDQRSGGHLRQDRIDYLT